ncbi:competence pheromone ComX [Paenibacillus sp. FSL L8-0436]|uniref:competence pheromone ComX n=1 Tax=Paenibacillus sp. FSL L8-0436 TaxID=2954686 RepID=UPI0031582092
MLKEMVQKLMADPSAWARVQTGQLQLAGMSETEHRALIDVLGSKEGKAEPRMAFYWS